MQGDALNQEISVHINYNRRLQQLKDEKGNILRVAVCGRFNSGKSSLLNLLLGLDLPVKAVTATGVITKIRYGAHSSVRLRDGRCLEVSREELDQYISVAEKTLDGVVTGEAVIAYVGCSHPLMGGGAVEFWDTPGLEDDPELTRITLDAVRQCDMAVLVLDANRFASQYEKLILRKFQEEMGGNLIVVVNRMDLPNDQERAAVTQAAERLLRDTGNQWCGTGPSYTSAKPGFPQISSFHDRMIHICQFREIRQECIHAACAARIRAVAGEWRGKIEDELEQVLAKKDALRSLLEQFSTLHDRQLEQEYKQDADQLKQALTVRIYQMDDMSQWRKVLETVKGKENWSSQYVALSQSAMKAELDRQFQAIFNSATQIIDRDKYPSCFPLPKIQRDVVWSGMSWGSNCSANNGGGMGAGVVGGAVAGSLIPGIGTIVGAGIGLVLGAVRDIGADNREKSEFESNCVSRTISAFQSGPASVARREAQGFLDDLLNRMRTDVQAHKLANRASPLPEQEQFDQVSQRQLELSRYLEIACQFQVMQ